MQWHFLESRKDKRIGRIGASGHQVMYQTFSNYVLCIPTFCSSLQHPWNMLQIVEMHWTLLNIIELYLGNPSGTQVDWVPRRTFQKELIENQSPACCDSKMIRMWNKTTNMQYSKWKGEVCDSLWLRMLHATLWHQSGFPKDAQTKICECLRHAVASYPALEPDSQKYTTLLTLRNHLTGERVNQSWTHTHTHPATFEHIRFNMFQRVQLCRTWLSIWSLSSSPVFSFLAWEWHMAYTWVVSPRWLRSENDRRKTGGLHRHRNVINNCWKKVRKVFWRVLEPWSLNGFKAFQSAFCAFCDSCTFSLVFASPWGSLARSFCFWSFAWSGAL